MSETNMGAVDAYLRFLMAVIREPDMTLDKYLEERKASLFSSPVSILSSIGEPQTDEDEKRYTVVLEVVDTHMDNLRALIEQGRVEFAKVFSKLAPHFTQVEGKVERAWWGPDGIEYARMTQFGDEENLNI